MDNRTEQPENIAPLTNYTRTDWVRYFQQLCFGAKEFLSEGKGRIYFPGCKSLYGEQYDSFSTMARILPLFSCWLYNPENPRAFQVDKTWINVESMLLEAFIAGTDKESVDYWGEMHDRISKIVEVNDIIWSLWLIKDTSLKKLNKNQMDNIMDWISQVYHKVIWKNNWQLTPVLVHLLKESLGYGDDYDISSELDCIEKLYRGDGWYSDSIEQESYDYYNAWQIHFGILIAVLIGRKILGEDLCQRYINRTQLFLKSFPYFWGSNGSYIPFGRSLSYKFAVLGCMHLARYMNISPLKPGLERRISSGSLKFFMENGSINPNNFLNCGYLSEPREKYEVYMFYGSPYWCSRGFLCLMFDKNNDFWTVTEDKLPVEEEDFTYPIPTTGFTLIGSKKNGHVQLLNSKNYSALLKRSEPFYSKFSYSSHLYFNYTMQKGACPSDSILYCSDSNDDYFRISELEVIEHKTDYIYRKMVQKQNGSSDCAVIKSYIIQSGIYQIRLHRAESKSRKIKVEEGSYPIAFSEDERFIEKTKTDCFYLTQNNYTIFGKIISGYEDIYLCKDFKGRKDMNLTAPQAAYINMNTAKASCNEWYLGSIFVGEPGYLTFDEIRKQLPEVYLDIDENAFFIKESVGTVTKYTFF